MILYADTVTPSMRAAMTRRSAAGKFRTLTTRPTASCPKTIIKDVREILEISKSEDTGHKAKASPKS